MEQRKRFYEQLSKSEAEMIWIALVKQDEANIIRLKFKEDELLMRYNRAILNCKKDAIPYHRLLHGPELEMRREVRKKQWDRELWPESFVYTLRKIHHKRGRLEWIDRLGNEDQRLEVEDALEERDSKFRLTKVYEARERRAEAQQMIASDKLDELHGDVHGPTADGSWWQMQAFSIHIPDELLARQKTREDILGEVDEDYYRQKWEQQGMEHKLLGTEQVMEQFQPNQEPTLDDLVLKKRIR